MGDLEESYEEEQATETDLKKSIGTWSYGTGEGSWQGRGHSIRERTGHLYNSPEMSDLLVNVCDENWWFGATVKDFSAHKFLLASASPVMYRLLYDWQEEDTETGERRLVLDPHFEVSLILMPCTEYRRLEIEGVPPIAAEALLEYVYKDTYNESDFDNGYSRNLLWRLWHASKALEMEHLFDSCTATIHRTMCEETVFWDLNYSIKYRPLGTQDIRDKVLKQMEDLDEKLFEHPNFVWLDHAAVLEILERRRPNSCEALTILNNLLRWSLYQLDRMACSEIDGGLTGADIPTTVRLEWIAQCRRGQFDHVTVADMDKYLRRGLEKMPWTEMSQGDFLQYVVKGQLVNDQVLLPNCIDIMQTVVQNPDRLTKSAYQCSVKTKKSTNSGQTKIASSLFGNKLKLGSTASLKDAKTKEVVETTRG